jgi:putative acetyltransferase
LGSKDNACGLTGRALPQEIGSSKGIPMPPAVLDPVIRPAQNGDAQDLFGLLALCFAEYPGCFVDPHDDLLDLLAPGDAFAADGGTFYVVEDLRGRVCACVALNFPRKGVAELHRLYVRPDRRGKGLGQVLTRRMEALARARQALRVILYSDTRFTKAHALYEKLGYCRGPTVRELRDVSQTSEYFYEKALV